MLCKHGTPPDVLCFQCKIEGVAPVLPPNTKTRLNMRQAERCAKHLLLDAKWLRGQFKDKKTQVHIRMAERLERSSELMQALIVVLKTLSSKRR